MVVFILSFHNLLTNNLYFSEARDIILPPGEIVFYGGTVSRDLYIIESGFCLITSKSLGHKNTERIVGPGNHLGLLVLLYGVPAVKTVITLTHCKVSLIYIP